MTDPANPTATKSARTGPLLIESSSHAVPARSVLAQPSYMNKAPQAFVHLHLHTEYSLVDGIVRVKPLVQAVAAASMAAVAVTEHDNVFSLVKFYQSATKAGIKPLLGVDFSMQNASDPSHPGRVLALCQSIDGYRCVARLLTLAYRHGQQRGSPELRPEWLAEDNAGLLLLSGAMAGDIGQAIAAGKLDDARRRAEAWATMCPDRFYVELQRVGRAGESQYVDEAVQVAAELGLPVVATNAVRFLRPEDFDAHEARVCINQGRVLADPRRPKDYSEQQFLRTPVQMIELFSDLPEAIENTVEVALRCNVELRLDESFLPEFPVPEGETTVSWFRTKAQQGLTERLDQLGVEPAKIPVYRDRLELELGVILQMGYPGYFLIVADFIDWARNNGVPVGPGRGSGAGSLVAYAMGITDLDPLAYDLLFERFLNPERVSLPDFDIDFCMEGRDRVIDYVSRRYGAGDDGAPRVAQIITYGTMAAKAVVRDVGRVLDHPYGFVDQLAKLIPFELGMTLDKALALGEGLSERYRAEEEVRLLIDLARKLEGLARNAGKHAGGVVISPTDLTEFAPLYCEPGSSSVVTQFDKDDVESVGLVKFDFLGLRTLTIIDRAVKAINAQRSETGELPVRVESLPTEDTATYDLIKSGATTAVFQLESRGMKDLIRRLQPDCFDDIIALVALFRPGPLQSGMVDDFIDVKHGRAEVSYPHPDLEPILKPTYGVILYQEQVMQIAQVLANYTLGGADLLRRAMGKKKPEEMALQREVFMSGALARDVDSDKASYIFDLMEKFAGYGFNKSHSAAYALIAFHTGWLKAHYPAEFMAAVLSADMDSTDKVVIFIDECRSMKLEVLPPDVNICRHAFTAQGDGAVRYGLGAIKGAGAAALDSVVAERNENGPFHDLFDFCRRVDTRKANRRVMEALIRSGALDGLGPSRASLMASLTYALQAAEQHERDISVGQNDMFGGAVGAAAEDPDKVFVEVDDWSEQERLTGEKETLGLYLTGHPITRFEAELAYITSTRIARLRPETGKKAKVAGLVVGLRSLNSRKGRMAIVTLDDRTARIEVVVYSDVFQKYRDLLTKDRLLIVEGELSTDEYTGSPSMMASRIEDIESAREAYAKHLAVSVCEERLNGGFLDHLARVLEPYRRGSTPVCIRYFRPDASVPLRLADEWRVRPTDELLTRLRELAGTESVEVEY